MKTTIIDILNKIANGEQPPKKILVNDNIYVWEEDGEYVNVDDELDLLFDFESYCQLQECLNMEVEILETTITYKQDDYIQYQPYTGEFNLKPQQEATPYEPYIPSKDDKIEKIDMFDYFTGYWYKELPKDFLEHLEKNFETLNSKINEIIDKLNKREK